MCIYIYIYIRVAQKPSKRWVDCSFGNGLSHPKLREILETVQTIST
jgi:hypothetical protein